MPSSRLSSLTSYITQKGIKYILVPKRKTPFFFTFRSLSNKQQLFLLRRHLNNFIILRNISLETQNDAITNCKELKKVTAEH